jgi:hypothetical protein
LGKYLESSTLEVKIGLQLFVEIESKEGRKTA